MALIEKFPLSLFLEGNTRNTGNTAVETYILGKFLRRGTRGTQSGYDSNTTLLLCLRVEELFEGVSEEGTRGTQSGFD